MSAADISGSDDVMLILNLGHCHYSMCIELCGSWTIGVHVLYYLLWTFKAL